MNDIQNTQIIGQIKEAAKPNVSDVLSQVYGALVEKGYNPINQIVGYIMSGDPTYITSHKNARSLIMKVERDEILEELMAAYVESRLS
ncbi:MAG TPA: IreB family regulatory phosphoprotein [Candidatus Avilachnospira avicola]|nr:IreB family regulatory phosphoprotein [Candidatus Avilachnospira avicola]